ncbi:YsnF/AvaK domain-containing protein [Botryobacter ruber]|uniref:YsnF/AvaK domain-containing protein n=1 Tax=Botryobacter ruber TaxID=2171629 RepID=UPI000E0C12A7|nr:YsnF/AvaK domain-containing protein [Botryobacter ruber]
MNRQTVIGIFDYGVDAQRAVQELRSNGFSNDKIDLSVNGARDHNDTFEHRHESTTSKVGNFFNSLFDSNEDSDRYTNVAQRGSVVTVHATSAEEATRAARLLDTCGAIDVNERAQNISGTTGMGSSNKGSWTNKTIPVVEENLNVGKREVETGGAHIRSRIIERPVEETMRLREEHVHIERNAVNRPANERDLRNFREGETEITEHAEVPVVEKEARVVEEIKLSKDVTEHDETIHGTVRKQDVDIDRLDSDKDRDLNRNRNRTDDRI